jgi:hypothetical protein
MSEDEDLDEIQAWLNAFESMIALLAAQLPTDNRARFAAALRELEATAPELNARLSWSAALNRVRLLIRDDDKIFPPSGEMSS